MRNHICEVTLNYAPGVDLIKTENGAPYFFYASDLNGHLPQVGEDIFDYKFIRAQPMTFQQDGTRFHRMIDGYALPFAEYQPTGKYTAGQISPEILRDIRNAFLQDMARQGVLARFI